MSVRTTVDIPDDLYAALRQKAARERTSIRALAVEALGDKIRRRTKRGIFLTGPPIPGSGKPGPQCPDRENPYDLLFG